MLFNPKKVQFREFEWSGSKLKGPAKCKKNSKFSSHWFVLAFDVIDRATNSCVVLYGFEKQWLQYYSWLGIYLYTRTYLHFLSLQEAPI